MQQGTTEWDDILDKFGIKASKQEEKKVEQELAIETKLDDDGFGFDEDDEAVFRKFRESRIVELQVSQMRPTFGEVHDIAGQDFIQEINKAGDDVWVVLHLFKAGVPLCSLINNYLNILAPKFRQTKFVKSVSNLCIANFPDSQLPAIFVYLSGTCKKQLVGTNAFGGMNLQCDELEWMLGKIGAVKTDLEENPKNHWNKSKGTKLFISNTNSSDEED